MVDAVIASGVHAILSKGWSDRGSKDKEEKGEAKDAAEVDDKSGADGVKYPPEIL